MRARLSLVTGLVLGPTLAMAQSLGPDPARLAWVDRLGAMRQAEEVKVGWDGDTGTFASLTFGGAGRPLIGAGAESQRVARWIETELAPLLDDGVRVAGQDEPLPGGGAGLQLVDALDLGQGRVRYDFDQVASGLPVHSARVQVEVARTPAGIVPVAVFARYFPGVPAGIGAEQNPEVTASLLTRFPGYEDGDIAASPEYRVVVARSAETGEYRAAWAVEHLRGSPPMGWRTFVDALTGEVLAEEERSCAASASGLTYDKNPGQTPRAARPLSGLYLTQGNNQVTTDGNGNHPLTGMVSIPAGLSGPLVRIFVSGEDEMAYTGPADVRLEPTESGTAQDEIAAFTSYMTMNAHLRATYPSFAGSRALTTRFALLVRYKQNGRPVNNAFFTPQRITALGETFTAGYMAMGTFGGNRQAARSSSVVQHEYMHALFSRIVDLGGNVQAGGINEGLADYFPCAKDGDPRVGLWLANPYIRDLSRRLRWPQDNNNEVHRVGNIFAGALWDARVAAGADAARIDQAVAAGVFRFPPRPSLVTARNAIVEADAAVNQGRFRRLIGQAFFERGIGPAPQGNRAPVLQRPADQTVAAGQTLDLQVQASDPDNDALTLMATVLQNSTVDGRGLRFRFTPDASQQGDVMVTLTVTDGDLTDSETFKVTVTAPIPGQTTPGQTVPGQTFPGGGVGPVGSTGTTAPGATPTFATGGGGGGGGCALSAGEPGSAFPALALLVLLGAALRLRAIQASEAVRTPRRRAS